MQKRRILWLSKGRVFLAGGLFLFSFLLLGLTMPWEGRSIPVAVTAEPIRRGEVDKPEIAFACNVFWGEEHLPAMLSVLAENQIKMTFFIGGTWAKEHPDLLKEIAAAGHEIGNHSYSHPHLTKISSEKNREQIEKAQQIIYEITGIKTELYAPPYGEYDKRVLAVAEELDYDTILWTVDTIDWQRPSAETIRQRVMKKVSNGAIILMHPTKPTAEVLPQLVQELRAKGYTNTTDGEEIFFFFFFFFMDI